MRLDILLAIESFRRVFGFGPLPREIEGFKPLRMKLGGSDTALYRLRAAGLLKPASGPPWPVELSLSGVEWLYSSSTTMLEKRYQRRANRWAERYIERQGWV